MTLDSITPTHPPPLVSITKDARAVRCSLDLYAQHLPFSLPPPRSLPLTVLSASTIVVRTGPAGERRERPKGVGKCKEKVRAEISKKNDIDNDNDKSQKCSHCIQSTNEKEKVCEEGARLVESPFQRTVAADEKDVGL